jgi:CDP-diglyceride synthetase
MEVRPSDLNMDSIDLWLRLCLLPFLILAWRGTRKITEGDPLKRKSTEAYIKARRGSSFVALLGLLGFFGGTFFHYDLLAIFGIVIAMLAGFIASMINRAAKSVAEHEEKTGQPSPNATKHPFLVALVKFVCLLAWLILWSVSKEHPELFLMLSVGLCVIAFGSWLPGVLTKMLHKISDR